MKKPETITVDGKSYDVNAYDTSVGMVLLTDIILTAGEPLINLFMSIKGDKKRLTEMEIEPAQIQMIMSGLYARVGSKTIDDLFKRMLAGTFIANSSEDVSKSYDTYFQGEYMHLFKVVFAVFKVQFSDFWKGLGASVNKAQAAFLK